MKQTILDSMGYRFEKYLAENKKELSEKMIERMNNEMISYEIDNQCKIKFKQNIDVALWSAWKKIEEYSYCHGKYYLTCYIINFLWDMKNWKLDLIEKINNIDPLEVIQSVHDDTEKTKKEIIESLKK